MKARTAVCPACGGPVAFQVSSSLVTICDFCHSVVARGDKKPEDCGKIADVADLNSPLSVGMTGSVENKAFHVTGRVQYKHPSGAMWNEWYLSADADGYAGGDSPDSSPPSSSSGSGSRDGNKGGRPRKGPP